MLIFLDVYSNSSHIRMLHSSMVGSAILCSILCNMPRHQTQRRKRAKVNFMVYELAFVVTQKIVSVKKLSPEYFFASFQTFNVYNFGFNQFDVDSLFVWYSFFFFSFLLYWPIAKWMKYSSIFGIQIVSGNETIAKSKFDRTNMWDSFF